MSYDQWKTASPWDDEEIIIDFTKELEELGKFGHGLAGKDADLDYGGQVKVVSAYVEFDKAPPIANVKIMAYANICQPNDEEKAEIAEFYVLDETGWEGEWTGSDYWTFTLESPYYEIEFDCPWIDPVEDDPDRVDKNRVAHEAYKAIFADQGVKDFRSAMADLAKTIDNIEIQEED